MFEALKNGKKAEFALDVIDAKEFETLTVPTYIAQALTWLENRLLKKTVKASPAMTVQGTTA